MKQAHTHLQSIENDEQRLQAALTIAVTGGKETRQSINDSRRIYEKAKKANRILYAPDNIDQDIFLIKELANYATIVVISQDKSLENIPNVRLLNPEQLTEEFTRSDLVIAKGKDNYDLFTRYPQQLKNKVAFLLTLTPETRTAFNTYFGETCDEGTSIIKFVHDETAMYPEEDKQLHELQQQPKVNKDGLLASLMGDHVFISFGKQKTIEEPIVDQELTPRIKFLYDRALQEHHLQHVVKKKHKVLMEHLDPTAQFETYLHHNPIIIEDKELIVGGIFLLWEDIDVSFEAGNEFKSLVGDSYWSVGVKGYSIRSPPGHYNVVKKGFTGIRDRALEKLKTEKVSSKRNFLKSVARAHNAACKHAAAYAKEALYKAQHETDSVRKQELLDIAEVCHNLSIRPPQTYREQIQAMWFGMTFGAVGDIGRVDQYLIDFYEKETKQGTLTKKHALELLECFFVKCGTIIQSWAVKHDSLQQIMTGGVKADGTDATNELSYLLFQAQYDLKCIEPKVNARFHDASTEKYLRAACKVLRLGLGMPALFNDNVVVPAFQRLGLPIEDARDYCNDGCSELMVNGKSTSVFVQTNLLQILVDTMNEKEFTSFEALKTAYKKRIANNIETTTVNQLTHPFFMGTVPDCLEEASSDAVRYVLAGCVAVATANAADGLAAIKKLVFDTKTFTWQEFMTAMHNNYKGEHENVRRLIATCPKFGNDDPTVDLFAKEIGEHFCDSTLEQYNDFEGNKKMSPALLAFDLVSLAQTDSSPDGRRKGDHVACSLSPCSGKDMHGPTAIVNSLAHIDSSKAPFGATVDMVFNASVFKPQTYEKFVGFINTWRKHKSTACLQVNFLDRDVLIKAKEDPTNPLYKNIMVRVWGFSAYFVDMDVGLQQNVIERCK